MTESAAIALLAILMLPSLSLGQTLAAADDKAKRAAGLPKDAAEFVARAGECMHWRGEEPYDKARGEEIAAAIRRLRCDGLEKEMTALGRKYKGNADVAKAFNAVRKDAL